MWPMSGDWPSSYIPLRSSCAPSKSHTNGFAGDSSFAKLEFSGRYPIGDECTNGRGRGPRDLP
jgi:hypothetical protein